MTAGDMVNARHIETRSLHGGSKGNIGTTNLSRTAAYNFHRDRKAETDHCQKYTSELTPIVVLG